MPKSGHITPSRFKDVMTRGRSKSVEWGATAMSYADELAMNLIGVQMNDISAPALEHGIELEPFAIQTYEMENFATITRVESPIHHPEYEYICGTMDGLVSLDGIIEVKCPFNPLNHWKNMLYASQYEKQYKWQIQGYLWITGREWCDFVSFHPDEAWGDNKLFTHRILRDQEIINQLEERLPLFWQIVQDKLDIYNKIS